MRRQDNVAEKTQWFKDIKASGGKVRKSLAMLGKLYDQDLQGNNSSEVDAAGAAVLSHLNTVIKLAKFSRVDDTFLSNLLRTNWQP